LTQRLCFFPYIGGKYPLLKTLLPLIPPHKVYCEVFGGAASLLLNKPPSPVEAYNDIDGSLINLFTVVRDKPDEFVKRFEWILYSRELFSKWLEEEEQGLWPEDPVERAARFYYILRSSFSGSVDKGWSFQKNVRTPRAKAIWNKLEEIKQISQRLKAVQIDHLDFRKCIKHWDDPNTLFYLDPPYHGRQYYRKKFLQEDHEDLKRMLEETRGKWLLTYNDDPWIREAYSRFHIRKVRQLKSASLVRAGGGGRTSPILSSPTTSRRMI